MTLSVLVITCVFWHKVPFKLQKILILILIYIYHFSPNGALWVQIWLTNCFSYDDHIMTTSYIRKSLHSRYFRNINQDFSSTTIQDFWLSCRNIWRILGFWLSRPFLPDGSIYIFQRYTIQSSRVKPASWRVSTIPRCSLALATRASKVSEDSPSSQFVFYRTSFSLDSPNTKTGAFSFFPFIYFYFLLVE